MYYIYKFLDKNQKDIYIGITNDIKRRINQQHFTNFGHLSESCYDETEYVIYSKCRSYDDARIKERYLINKNNPKYNLIHKNKSEFCFEINDFEWFYIPFDKNKLKNKKVKATNNKLKTEYLYGWNDIQEIVCDTVDNNLASELTDIIDEIMNYRPNSKEIMILNKELKGVKYISEVVNIITKLSRKSGKHYVPYYRKIE